MSSERSSSNADFQSDSGLHQRMHPKPVFWTGERFGVSSAKVLLGFRDGLYDDWKGVCRAFEVDPEHLATTGQALRARLNELREAGLLEFDAPESSRGLIQGKIVVSPRLSFFQSALGVSLTALARSVRYRTMMVTPQFSFCRPTIDTDIFVLMPFNPEFDEVYEDVIKQVGIKLKLGVSRADELFGPRSIVTDIWSSLVSAKVVVADCTQRNPNVFYEIGLAHAIGKPVVLLAQNDSDVPFDLRHIRYIKYSLTPRGAKALLTRLSKSIRAAMEDASQE